LTELAPRILIIGLDSATFDLIEPWAAQGYLPQLARLMAEGSHGPLASTLQPTTAPAWTTFMTGVNQGEHGLYDFVRRRADSYNVEVTNSTHVKAPTFFEIASRYGQHVISVNMPYTFPPRPVNGVMVGGPFAPAFTREVVYPPELFETIKTIAPDYFILTEYNPRAADPQAAYAQALLHEVELRKTVVAQLMQTLPWDVCAVVTMATDEVQHTFWQCMTAPDDDPLAQYREVIREVYQRVDQLIGHLIELAANDGTGRPTIVMVLSDHGAGSLRWMINLNQWLAEAGYLKFQTEKAGALKSARADGLQRLMQTYKRVLPTSLRESIRARLGAQRFHRLKGEFESALVTAVVDWKQTRAYSLGAGGNLFINLAGREPQGVVQPGAEYEQVCAALIEQLQQLRDPETGAYIVECVHHREEIYHGAELEHAPDLIVRWRDHTCWGRGLYGNQTPVFEAQRQFDFSDQPLSGTHRPEGVLILWGPAIRSGVLITGARLIDLAPTILALLGLPVPEIMDGSVLAAAVKSAAQAAPEPPGELRQVTAEHEYTPEEEALITQHLKDLGYL
jgi:predicted AlkP superfamily phosphohydrolase/phosphomutase